MEQLRAISGRRLSYRWSGGQLDSELSQRRLGVLAIENASANCIAAQGQGLRLSSCIIHDRLGSRRDAVWVHDTARVRSVLNW